jgi:hypothetical protein
MAQDYERLLKNCADELELIECKLTNPDGTYYNESKCILKHIKYMCGYLVLQPNESKHDINILLEAISRYLIAAQFKRFTNRFEFYLKNSSRIGIWNYSLRLTAFAYSDMLPRRAGPLFCIFFYHNFEVSDLRCVNVSTFIR